MPDQTDPLAKRPLVALLEYLYKGVIPPFDFVIEHAPDGDFASAVATLWGAEMDPQVLRKAWVVTGDGDALVRVAAAAALLTTAPLRPSERGCVAWLDAILASREWPRVERGVPCRIDTLRAESAHLTVREAAIQSFLGRKIRAEEAIVHAVRYAKDPPRDLDAAEANALVADAIRARVEPPPVVYRGALAR